MSQEIKVETFFENLNFNMPEIKRQISAFMALGVRMQDIVILVPRKTLFGVKIEFSDEVDETTVRRDYRTAKTPSTERKFLYWYQETPEGFTSMYGTFLSHEEAVEVFKGKYKYGLVSPNISY